MNSAPASELEKVFEHLSAILRPYAAELDCKADEPGRLYVDTRHIMTNKKPLFFSAVEVKKAYVSYHLMPVYVNPSLLDGMSEGLAARMHGKSCFNFRHMDEALLNVIGGMCQSDTGF